MSKYLYNGMELPPLPEYDKTKYPYVFIWKEESIVTTIYLYLLSEIVYQTATDNTYCLVARELVATTTPTSDGWSAFSEYPYGSGVTSLFQVGYKNENKWANFDILNEDGTVSLSASYPIDAETGEEIHDYEIGNIDTTPIPSDAYIVKGGKVYKVKGGSAQSILTFDSVDEMNAATAPDGTIALVPSEGESGTGGLPVVEITSAEYPTPNDDGTAGDPVALSETESAALTAAIETGLPVIIKISIGGTANSQLFCLSSFPDGLITLLANVLGVDMIFAYGEGVWIMGGDM